MDSNTPTAEKADQSQFLKNIGNKLVHEEDGEIKSVSLNNELEHLKGPSTITNIDKEKIILKEKEIENLKNELEITYEEAKSMLIRHRGDFCKAVEFFLNDFKYNKII